MSPGAVVALSAGMKAPLTPVPSSKFKRLFVAISTVGAPPPDACVSLLRAMPHRHLVGQLIDIGENPLLSPWAGFAQRHGLGLTTYAPSPDESALELSEQELILATVRGLRDPKIDAILLLGLTSPPAPLVRLVHASGRPIILGVRSGFVDRALRVADSVIDLDAVEVALAEVAS